MKREIITELAAGLGIDVIGFTDSSPLERVRQQLVNRESMGLSTEFEERDIEKRLDPRKTMDSCKSIIVIGVSYNKSNYPKKKARVKGSLSMSSWGTDYHKILNGKMELLANEMKKYWDFEHKSFSDTGPLVDRELAFKAGLGYYGKNCSIINPVYGSFIFIGYILTDLEIATNHLNLDSLCGECTLCIDACPTSALGISYELEPKRCVSYLTQTKDPIPEELSSKMGIKIYGCDTCQVVCPKNKGVIQSEQLEFDPIKTGGIVDIEELVGMTKKEYSEKYREMAGSWRGKTVLLRNSLIAMENTKSRGLKDIVEILDRKNVELLKPYTSRILREMAEE